MGGMEMEVPIEPAEYAQQNPRRETYFVGSVPRLKLPFSYQFSLTLVALAMILLPAIYLGILASVGWGVWWWATHANDWLFPHERGGRRIYWILLLIYVSPILLGVILVLFMFKSFFSTWRVEEFARPISHEQHPELFQFLGQLCQAMGAPIPSRVDVTLSSGASAGFRAGFGSLFGNDIMLTFGLPLVAGMTCREFAAVIAHEFAHFTQRWAMRASYVIHSIHGWLARAVYEHHDFDYWLYEESGESAFALVLFTLARVMVALIRGLMYVLLGASHFLSSYMSRQMEFHADALASRVAGSDGFVSMFQRLRLLNASFEQAGVKLAHKVQARLPDDMATYVAMLASQASGEMQGKLLAAAGTEKTKWYESHPALADRLARVRAANEPGIIFDDRPSTMLFRGFQEMSRELTLDGYKLSRRPPKPEQIFKVEAPAAESVPDTSQQEAAIKAYFVGLGLFLRPLAIGPESRMAVGFGSDKADIIRQAKAFLEQGGLPMRERIKELDARWSQALMASALVNAGLEFPAEAFPLMPAGQLDFGPVFEDLQRQQAQLENDIEPYERSAKTRLLTSLGLLRTYAVAAKIPDTQQLQDEVTDLEHALGKVSKIFPKLLEMRRELGVLQTLEGARHGSQAEAVEAAFSEVVRKCGQWIREAQSSLGAAGYPFPHPLGQITMAEYARAKAYDPDAARMAKLEVESHLQMLFAIYHRALGRLVEIALMVEKAVKG